MTPPWQSKQAYQVAHIFPTMHFPHNVSFVRIGVCLYVTNRLISGRGARNVIVVAAENDNIVVCLLAVVVARRDFVVVTTMRSHRQSFTASEARSSTRQQVTTICV